MLKDADVKDLLSQIADSLIEDVSRFGSAMEPLDSVRKCVAARVACHSSIRGREVPDRVRISELLKSLDACDEPHRCPHGRPTRILISAAELKKMFRK